MMGIKERHFSSLPDDVSLEELVPKDNFYRRLQGALDLSFVRDLVKDRYAFGGRPSIDPVVFFRLQLILFFEGLRSERQLMEVVADRLSLRWFVGYDLHEPLPDHSSLTRIRERYGLETFRRFFERIVEECFEAGLVRGDELFFDSTKVRADADIDSLCSRSIAENHLDGLFEEEIQEPEAESSAAPRTPPTTALPAAEDSKLAEENGQRGDWIGRAGRQDRAFSSGPRKRTADLRVSRTDPDATPMRVGEDETKLGYQAHYVVDGGKARIIVGALVTSSEVTENRPMLDLLWRTTFRWGLKPHHVTGDGKYGTAENIAAVEDADIRAYVGLHEAGGRGSGFFPKSVFSYDAERDVYLCPAGGLLRPLGDADKRRRLGEVVTYRAVGSVCAACPLKPECTTNKNGRNIRRGPGDEYIDRVRAYHGTFSYEKALRKRKVWIEPLFAEAKDWHGMRRFRLRGLEKVNIEALLIASGQNVKRLLAFGGRRPKKLAQVAALRPPTAPGDRISRIRDHRWSPSW
jgi:transposase